MVEITIQVPESLAEQISEAQLQLPEILERGLEQSSSVPNQVYRQILEFLISQPSPEELLNFAPTDIVQQRVDELLEKDRAGVLTQLESAELDEYVRINHLITMLKARTLPYLIRDS